MMVAYPSTSGSLVPKQSEELFQDELTFRGETMPYKLSLDQEGEQITSFPLKPPEKKLLLLRAESLGAKEVL